MFRPILKMTVFAFLLLIVNPNIMYAEETFILYGEVRVFVGDYEIYLYELENEFQIPEASIQITSTSIGETYSAITDSSGHYSIELPVENIGVGKNRPESFVLKQNYPNPFNPSTTIEYEIPEDDHVRLTLYNTAGQRVRTLVDEWKTSGFHSIIWDGYNDNGAGVSTGVYLYRLRTGMYEDTRKMMLVDGSTGVYPLKTGSPLSYKAGKHAESGALYDITIEKDGFETRQRHKSIPAGSTDVEWNFTLEQLNYFPLEVGNSWTFERNESSDNDANESITYTVIEKKKITFFKREYEYFLFDSFPVFIYQRPSPHLYPEETLLRTDETGALRIWEGTADLVLYFFNFTTPSKESMESRLFMYNNLFFCASELTTKIVSVNDTVEINDTTLYPCYRFYVTVGGPDAEKEYWFAPGIGPIKIESKAWNDIYTLKYAVINGVEYEF